MKVKVCLIIIIACSNNMLHPLFLLSLLSRLLKGSWAFVHDGLTSWWLYNNKKKDIKYIVGVKQCSYALLPKFPERANRYHDHVLLCSSQTCSIWLEGLGTVYSTILIRIDIVLILLVNALMQSAPGPSKPTSSLNM